jgi:DNA-binding beta-propeller fold protein YncE
LTVLLTVRLVCSQNGFARPPEVPRTLAVSYEGPVLLWDLGVSPGWAKARQRSCLFYFTPPKIPYNAAMRTVHHIAKFCFSFLLAATPLIAQDSSSPSFTQIPNSKLFGEVPGHPRRINNFPTAAAISPDARYAVFLHSGFGAYTSARKQSLTVLDLQTDTIRDFPDDRLGPGAKQTYFLGLAFSLDGQHLYASMASLTDPLGKGKGSTGNGIAVYAFQNGAVAPERFLPLTPRTGIPRGKVRRAEFNEVTYPAGLSVGLNDGVERLLVASNSSDEALLLNTSDGKIVHRFDLSTFKRIPASLPYTAVMTSDGKRGFVSLWNASAIAELDLQNGSVRRFIPLRKPSVPLESGSHPTALLLSGDNSRLFVALTNRDEIDVLDTKSAKLLYSLSTKLPDQTFGGSDPESLALSSDEKTLFSANAISDSVAVFDLSHPTAGEPLPAVGFIPTEWYPTVVAATGTDLLIGSAKGRGSGPNPVPQSTNRGQPRYPYNPAMTNGSLARIPLNTLKEDLAAYTALSTKTNAAQGNVDRIPFAAGENKIHHVIYIIKENRTYDQLFGDLSEANGDAHITMYGEDITPNQHKLARQFGILDNFYDSGDVSGDGHIWSTSASISDYVEKTWPIGYRAREHTYDSEGEFLLGVSAEDELPYAGEPTGGFLWKNFAKHNITYRHYGEFIVSRWCKAPAGAETPSSGPPEVAGVTCTRAVIKKGEPLEKNVGDPRGGASPYPWEIPILAKDVAAQVELRDHFDPLYPDFEIAYPDQLRVDEFLNEFNAAVSARQSGTDSLPQFILLRLPNDHTAGGTKGKPRPAASVADNDLAVGRVADAISHSPYWDDTAILVLEDDAQDGPDHVDSHRSIALVISKYAPPSQPKAFVDHTFYTTINVVRTIESLLGAPPMNANDSRAALMAPLFSGPGTQSAFEADYRNRDNGLLYEMNTKDWKEGKNLDFSHADAADNIVLNKFLWHDRMGHASMPAPQHNVFPASASAKPNSRDPDD